jgi:hypothetical protein
VHGGRPGLVSAESRGVISSSSCGARECFARRFHRDECVQRRVKRRSALDLIGHSPGLVRSTGYFVIELKTGKFQPEYAGKLNFYIALVDDWLRREAHADPVGIHLRQQERPHCALQPRPRHLTHGRRLLHLRRPARRGPQRTAGR